MARRFDEHGTPERVLYADGAAPLPAEDAAPPAEPPAEPPAAEPATPEPEVDPLTGLPISSTKKRVVAPKAGLFDEDEEKEG